MQKRANLALTDLAGRQAIPLLLIGLTLVGFAAGGHTVGTVGTFYGGAEAKVETSIARQGPKGTTAEFSTQRRAGWAH
ncbi:hypothetical protein DYH55_13275 [Methylovirgula sp. 4M-Z18]|nr:hypothetical protein DYH55_13275 [Methylovirgula sp. 4M-Z18]